jgi:hypothetical protein
VKRFIPVFALAVACLLPAMAVAGGMIDASLIPDGTYTVKVDKVVDQKHLLVTMDNGFQANLGAGRDSVDFSKVKPSDSVKITVIKGNIMVYEDLSH